MFRVYGFRVVLAPQPIIGNLEEEAALRMRVSLPNCDTGSH